MIAPAVAKAAMDSGVATRPIADFAAYREKLGQFVYRSGLLMKPVFDRARRRRQARRLRRRRGRARAARRADGGRRRPGAPILIGRPEVIDSASSASACACARVVLPRHARAAGSDRRADRRDPRCRRAIA
jgi:malate dehydrogenase (oxaloacetate-decarboxylating)(NADP+)